MKRNVKCIVAVLIVILVSTVSNAQDDIKVKVLRVIDGDTLEVKLYGRKEKLRLIGIDAPETKHPRKPVEYFGREATAEAKRLLEGKTVFIELDYSQGLRDKYGRVLCYIWFKNRVNYNLHMIRGGFAKEYTYRRAYRHQKQFKWAEKEAAIHNKGLWGGRK
jgi:micrococcal nuclease